MFLVLEYVANRHEENKQHGHGCSDYVGHPYRDTNPAKVCEQTEIDQPANAGNKAKTEYHNMLLGSHVLRSYGLLSEGHHWEQEAKQMQVVKI